MFFGHIYGHIRLTARIHGPFPTLEDDKDSTQNPYPRGLRNPHFQKSVRPLNPSFELLLDFLDFSMKTGTQNCAI